MRRRMIACDAGRGFPVCGKFPLGPVAALPSFGGHSLMSNHASPLIDAGRLGHVARDEHGRHSERQYLHQHGHRTILRCHGLRRRHGQQYLAQLFHPL